MKLRLRKHTTTVLTGHQARKWMAVHGVTEPVANLYNAVAYCSCGWYTRTIHGELAEAEAAEHRA